VCDRSVRSEASSSSLCRGHFPKSGRRFEIQSENRVRTGHEKLAAVYCRLSQFEDYDSVDMVLDNSSGRHVAGIPAEYVVLRGDLMYFVEALDDVGNGRMVPDLEDEMP